ncbi:MFS transporter [Staphylococcus chromogenes]|nr:MFS transporter [Staphylococcus chromogenes]PTG21754.1 MFS transporter [Staphylococcus chromogenes]
MKIFWSKRARMFEIAIMSFLTIIGIGSQFYLNLAYSLNQGLYHYALGIHSDLLIIPAIMGNFAFAFGVPLGHLLVHKFGFRKNFMLFSFIFLIGSIIGFLSFGIVSLSISKVIQGFSTGVLFFTMLPKTFHVFPKRFKNVFLFMIIVGLFGANALGGLTGSITLFYDQWQWVYPVNMVSAVICLLAGWLYFEREEPNHSTIKEDHSVVFFLALSSIFLLLPLCLMTQYPVDSLQVWPWYFLTFILFALFLITNERSNNPIVHFSTLLSPKPLLGSVMAIVSHLTLLIGIAAINFYLLQVIHLSPSQITLFYIYFFIGVLITGVLKMIFYSAWGPGVLGTIGSIALLYVSIHWYIMQSELIINLLYFQGMIIGFGASMVLVSGAMSTLLDGDLSRASHRSLTMHSIRNYFAAILVPIIAVYMKHKIQKGINDVQYNNIENKAIILKHIHDVFMDATNQLFFVMIILSTILLISSLSQFFFGKSRRIVAKRK